MTVGKVGSRMCTHSEACEGGWVWGPLLGFWSQVCDSRAVMDDGVLHSIGKEREKMWEG